MKPIKRRSVLQGIAGAGVVALTGCGGGGGSGSGAPPTGGGGPVTPQPQPAAIPVRPQYTPQQSSAPASPYDIGVDIDWFVDAEAGDDAAAGSEAAPFRTIDRAREVAGAQEIIGLKRGQTHFRTVQSPPRRNVTQSIVGYGDSVEPATISGGQSLNGAVWTLHGNGIYRTQITLPDPHLNGGSGLSGTSTTYPFVREEETYFSWVVGGAEIADNLAQLAALGGAGFAINASGSPVADIREDTTRLTVFDLYVRLADGSDPSGRDLITLAHTQAYKYGSELLQDLRIRDAWGKDTTGTAERQPVVPMLRRIEILGAGAHGWVGTCQVDGFRAVGFARPGMFEAEKGRASGAGLNLYSSEDRDVVVTIKGLDVTNFGAGLYGHTSSTSSQFAERIEVTASEQEGFADFRVRNSLSAIKFDAKNRNTVLPGGLTVECEVDLVDIDSVLVTESDASLTGGGVAIFALPAGLYQFQVISQLRTGTAKHLYRDMVFFPPRPNSRDLDLEIARGGTTAQGTPEVSFVNCELPLHPDYTFRVGTRFDTDYQFHLAQSGTTEMGDFVPPDKGTVPLRFEAEGTGAFALADRSSRSAARSYLEDRGAQHSISNSVTMLRSDGRVVEGPS